MWNQDLVVEATGGKIFGIWNASGVCLDTRKLNQGDIFIAFKGEKLDGHDMLTEAFAKGASAAMVEYIPEGIDKERLVLVENTAKALEDLAIYHRDRLDAKFIAITGSVGKTSTKEEAFLVFSELGKSYMTKGNYNNNLGLPITLASIPLDTKYAIIEMGMSSAGEITYLTKLAKPDIAIITNVEGVHLEFFDSIAGIVAAKSEIFLGMSSSATAILNNTSPYIELMKDYATKAGVANIKTFGGGGDAYATRVNSHEVEAVISGETLNYNIGSYGMHHITNSLAVLLAVKSLGGDLQKASKGLAKFKNIKGRGEVNKINIGGKIITVIDDSYNASPVSVKAALAVLGGNFSDAKRKLAILADMRELGEDTINLHKSLADAILTNRIDKVIAVGELMHNLFTELPDSVRLRFFNNTEEAIENTLKYIENGDAVLVKGSFGTGIHRLVDFIKEYK